MAIDIRANVTCSLGAVISGSIGDDYIQGSGLIKTRGSVLIPGLITPNVGTIVTFQYTKSGITRSIPRKLRVISSFADPFRLTTQVELGCKLTYLSDLQEPLKWDAFNDPENASYTTEDSKIITVPIHASSVMQKCLDKLGISANQIPLTNKFSISKFDFSGGYVEVLSDLLLSESYLGYLDNSEILQVVSLGQDAGAGPAFQSSDIIDLGPIGVGAPPGEAVTVSYSTQRLKPPDPGEEDEEEENQDAISRINWELNTVTSSPEAYFVNYRNAEDELLTNTYNSISSTTTTTNYRVISVSKEDGEKEEVEVVDNRRVTETVNAIAKLSNCAAKYAEAGFTFDNSLITTVTSTNYDYDQYGNEIATSSLKFEPEAALLGAANFDWVYDDQPWPVSYSPILSERITTTSSQAGDYTQRVVSTYIRFPFTQAGQQAIAIAREFGAETIEAAQSIVDAVLGGGLVHNNTTTEIRRTGASQSQGRPDAAERINAELSKDGDPNNGWRTDGNAQLELAVGSATAQRRIEFSMPYAPDDRFIKIGSEPATYTSVPSDAPAKANHYGRVQNRLLLGNRNGINLQISPERLPAAPFSPLYVQADGLTAMYRANGTSWAFDSNGVVASVDALFWAAVGGTGTFWFPVAPGVITLPETPAIVDTSPTEVIGTIETVGATPQTALNAAFPTATSGDGVQDQETGDFWVYDGSIWNNVGTAPGPTTTATTIVLPYNETAIYNGILRIRLSVIKFDYSLTLLTEVDYTLTLSSGFEKITPIYMPAPTDFVVAAAAPGITNSFDLRISNVPDISITTDIPEIRNSIDIRILTAPDFTIETHVPQVGSGIGLAVLPPTVALTVAAPVPEVGSGIGLAIAPPVTTVTIAAGIPTITTV